MAAEAVSDVDINALIKGRPPSPESSEGSITDDLPDSIYNLLTEEQIKDMKQAFRVFDKNGDGFISATELQEALEAMGENPSPERIQALMAEMDNDGSGDLDFEEFAQIIAYSLHDHEGHEKKIMDAFKVFDPDGKGYIAASRLREIMTTTGEKMTEEEADEMMLKLDIQPDGQVTAEDFLRALGN